MDRIAAAAAADGRIYLIAGKTLWTSTPSGAGLVRGVEVLDRTGPPEFAWLGEGVAGVVDLGGRVANTWRGEWTAMAIRPGSPRTLLLAERGGGIRSIPERKRAGDSLPGKELPHVGEPVARMSAGIAGDRQVLVLVTASGRILVADLPPRPMPAEPPGRGVRVTRKQGGPRGEAPAPADVAAGGAAQDAAATQDAAAAEPAGAEPNDQVESRTRRARAAGTPCRGARAGGGAGRAAAYPGGDGPDHVPAAAGRAVGQRQEQRAADAPRTAGDRGAAVGGGPLRRVAAVPRGAPVVDAAEHHPRHGVRRPAGPAPPGRPDQGVLADADLPYPGGGGTGARAGGRGRAVRAAAAGAVRAGLGGCRGPVGRRGGCRARDVVGRLVRGGAVRAVGVGARRAVLRGVRGEPDDAHR